MKIRALALAVFAAGCGGGVTREEFQVHEANESAKLREETAKLRSDLTGTEQKYVSVQQLQLKVEKQLKDMEEMARQMEDLSKALQTKVDLANSNVLKVLEFEERLLSDRLASLRAMIEELKKK